MYPEFLEIDASSDLGIDGNINITGITDLGSQFIQPEPVIISQTPLELAECPLNGQQTALSSRSSDRSLNKFKVEAFAIDNKSSTSENPKRLKPAVGWYRKIDGTVVLTDDPNKVRPLSMPIDYSTQCQK